MDLEELDEDIIIEREKVEKPKYRKNSSKPTTKSRSKTKSSSKKVKPEIGFHLKVTGVLVLILTSLLLLSFFSYSRADMMNTNLPFSELFSIFDQGSLAAAKADLTKNLLGILGAKVTQFFFISFLGFSSFLLLYIMILIGRDLLLDGWIRESSYKKGISTLLLSVGFSATMGAWSLAFNELPIEWYGGFGFFISKSISNLIGIAGSIIVMSLIFIVLIAMTFNIDAKLGISYLSRLGKAGEKKIKDNRGSFIFGFQEQILSLKQKVFENRFSNEDRLEEKDKRVDSLEINNANNQVPDKKVEHSPTSDKDILEINTEPRFGTGITINTFARNEVQKKDAIKKLFDSDEDDLKNTNVDDPIDLTNKNIETETQDQFTRDIPFVHLDADSDLDKIANTFETLIDDLPSNTDNIKLEQKSNNHSKKDPLRVTVKEQAPPEYDEPLSTRIHDKEIGYRFPTVDLLDQTESEIELDDEELKMNARILEEKLQTFKINISNLEVTPGPVVTQYEFVPGEGVMVSKIGRLSDDLAMALRAKGIRIIAPIPGKGTVGVEIPNNNPSLVRFSSVIATKAFKDCTYELPVALGKGISGDIFIIDLAKMPHLLIAGATGAGKSVGVNGLISSLLYAKHPKDLKFVIIDPKQVEMSQYAALKYHYMAASPDIDNTIVTDSDEAKLILQSVTKEMENRYTILAKAGERKITDYNKKVKKGAYSHITDIQHREMPYIVVIIDELADLMMTAGKEVELPIVRLAQKARAVGIHLVVATQRPSVDVVTGLIKANFPARISYMVASAADSKTILDGPGADKLLGSGDMLVLPAGTPKPHRVQNSYISTEEIDNICQHIANQNGYDKPYMLPTAIEEGDELQDIDPSDRDVKFKEAAMLVISQGEGSTSMLQRSLGIGFARAGRIVDQLASAGVLGPKNGSKPRELLIDDISDVY
ncbi:MAG: DNA translocase FtsK [Candidatus Kapaibacteriales bacterium]